jgi:hypothetical protein
MNELVSPIKQYAVADMSVGLPPVWIHVKELSFHLAFYPSGYILW